MNVLDISPISSAQPVSPMTDTVSTADDAQRLQLMEEMLRDRGYSRNQYGFWRAPGSRMTAAKVGSEWISERLTTEDEAARSPKWRSPAVARKSVRWPGMIKTTHDGEFKCLNVSQLTNRQ